jgi:hypothetical protein
MLQKLHTPSYTYHDQMDEWIKHTHTSENMILTLYEGFFHEKNSPNLSDFEKKIKNPKLPDFLW